MRMYTCENTAWIISGIHILKYVSGWKIIVFVMKKIAFSFDCVQLWDKKRLCFSRNKIINMVIFKTLFKIRLKPMFIKYM